MTVRRFSEPGQVAPRYLNTVDAAHFLGASPRTLEALRLSGDGPPFFKLGQKSVRYSVDELIQWAERQGRRVSTSDRG